MKVLYVYNNNNSNNNYNSSCTYAHRPNFPMYIHHDVGYYYVRDPVFWTRNTFLYYYNAVYSLAVIYFCGRSEFKKKKKTSGTCRSNDPGNNASSAISLTKFGADDSVEMGSGDERILLLFSNRSWFF